LSYCLSTSQPLSRRSGNACSPGWSTQSAVWLAASAAVPALGLSEAENSKFEAQLPFSQSKSVFSILACHPSRQTWAKGKDHCYCSSEFPQGFYGLPWEAPLFANHVTWPKPQTYFQMSFSIRLQVEALHSAINMRSSDKDS